jgi:hypothetical protein
MHVKIKGAGPEGVLLLHALFMSCVTFTLSIFTSALRLSPIIALQACPLFLHDFLVLHLKTVIHIYCCAYSK